jgi:MoxR-like ATPase
MIDNNTKTIDLELVVIGQEELKRYLNLFAESIRSNIRFNLLIEGAPGTAKTLAVKNMVTKLQKELNSIPFVRVTGSHDAIPSDLIGDIDIKKYKEGISDIINGPLLKAHGNEYPGVIYVDEFNRFSEYTLITFTEIMAEWQVSFPKTPLTKPLKANIIATMNPYDISGVTDVPQHILDRFNARIIVNYPAEEVEVEIAKQHINYYYKKAFQSLKPYYIPLISTTRILRKIGVALGPRAYLSTLDLLALEYLLKNKINNEIVIEHYKNSIRAKIANMSEDKQSEIISTATITLTEEFKNAKRIK